MVALDVIWFNWHSVGGSHCTLNDLLAKIIRHVCSRGLHTVRGGDLEDLLGRCVKANRGKSAESESISFMFLFPDNLLNKWTRLVSRLGKWKRARDAHQRRRHTRRLRDRRVCQILVVSLSRFLKSTSWILL